MFESKVFFWVCTKADNFQLRPVVDISIGATSLGPVEMPMKGVSRAPFDQPSYQAATVDHHKSHQSLRLLNCKLSFERSHPQHLRLRHIPIGATSKEAGGWNARAPFDQLTGCHCWSSDNPQKEIGLRVSDNLTASFHFRLLHQDQEGGDEKYWSEK